MPGPRSPVGVVSPAGLAVGGLLCLLWVILESCQGGRTPADFSGRWAGTLGEGVDSVGFFIDVEVPPDDIPLAEADVPIQGIQDLPLAVDTRGDSLFFRMGGSEDSPHWRGRLRRTDSILEGVFTMRGEELPLPLHRVSEPKLSDELRALRDALPESLRVVTLSSDSRELRDEFNANRDRVRLVLLLSPS